MWRGVEIPPRRDSGSDLASSGERTARRRLEAPVRRKARAVFFIRLQISRKFSTVLQIQTEKKPPHLPSNLSMGLLSFILSDVDNSRVPAGFSSSQISWLFQVSQTISVDLMASTIQILIRHF